MTTRLLIMPIGKRMFLFGTLTLLCSPFFPGNPNMEQPNSKAYACYTFGLHSWPLKSSDRETDEIKYNYVSTRQESQTGYKAVSVNDIPNEKQLNVSGDMECSVGADGNLNCEINY